jgi:glycosyltransferase involved in cell wall biosynthesis
MKIAIGAEPPRVASCTALVLSQATALTRLDNDVSVVIQKQNVERISPVYPQLSRLKLRLLQPVPILSKLSSTPWKLFLKGFGAPSLNYDWVSMIDPATTLWHGVLSHLWIPPLELDAMIGHTTYSPLCMLAWFKTSRIRKILYLHDWPISTFMKLQGNRGARMSRLAGSYERDVLLASDVVVCLTKTLAKVWEETFNVKPLVVYPGCEPSQEPPDRKDDIILSVWRWQHDTRPFFLIDLMKRLERTKLRLVMVGSWQDPILRKRFEESVAAEGLSKRILILTNVSWEKLLELYRCARCIIYPAWNSFGYAGLEAASQGTPLVAPVRSGLWEMFEAGKHGFEVVEGDIDSYAVAVERLQDESLTAQMARNIWEKSREYDWDNHGRKMMKIITG